MANALKEKQDFLDRLVTFVGGTYRNDKCVKLLG